MQPCATPPPPSFPLVTSHPPLSLSAFSCRLQPCSHPLTSPTPLLPKPHTASGNTASTTTTASLPSSLHVRCIVQTAAANKPLLLHVQAPGTTAGQAVWRPPLGPFQETTETASPAARCFICLSGSRQSLDSKGHPTMHAVLVRNTLQAHSRTWASLQPLSPVSLPLPVPPSR